MKILNLVLHGQGLIILIDGIVLTDNSHKPIDICDCFCMIVYICLEVRHV